MVFGFGLGEESNVSPSNGLGLFVPVVPSERFERFPLGAAVLAPVGSGVAIAGAGDGDLRLETMPVQPVAFVSDGHLGQAVRGFEWKGFAEFEFHGEIVAVSPGLAFPIGPAHQIG